MNAREILRAADEHHANARHARKAVDLLEPGVGLGLSIGTFQVDGYGQRSEIREVVQRALVGYAEEQERRAAEVESRVTVTS